MLTISALRTGSTLPSRLLRIWAAPRYCRWGLPWAMTGPPTLGCAVGSAPRQHPACRSV